jgi:hypothetical protein
MRTASAASFEAVAGLELARVDQLLELLGNLARQAFGGLDRRDGVHGDDITTRRRRCRQL